MQDARDFMQKHTLPAPSSSARRDALRRILRAQPARRQADLVRELQAQGFEVTQSSVSRDLRELGAARIKDRYVLAEDGLPGPTPVAVLAGFVREVLTAGPNLTVVKTATGAAQSVALAIDRDRWSDVVGTISGDDTIFIASIDGEAQLRIVDRLRTTFNV
jgi:transcriptional regulator of arginine metabolism